MENMGIIAIKPERVSRALLENVFHPVTAVVSLDDQGGIISAELYDTEFCVDAVREAAGCCEVWMMTNHPDGDRALSEQDIYNAAILKSRMHGRMVRVFVTGEDIGCVEVPLTEGQKAAG